MIGVDANGDNLRAASQRAAAKPNRGGLPNALFGRLALEDAPGELLGLADELSILLPWGSLLGVVAGADQTGLARLRGLCRPGAGLHVVFGHGPADSAAVAGLDLLDLDHPGLAAKLAGGYQAAGFAVTARPLAVDAVRALPTTWAKKLAYSGKPRRFWELRGRATLSEPPGIPPAGTPRR